MSSLSDILKRKSEKEINDQVASTFDEDGKVSMGDAGNKIFVFVSDSKLSPRIRVRLELYSPILTYQNDKDDALFSNRSVEFLLEKKFKSIWIVNKKSRNKWLQEQLTHHRNKMVVIGCYKKCKKQLYLQQLNPDIVIKTSNLGKLAVLTVEELIQHIESSSLGNRLSESAGFLERMFSCGKLIGDLDGKKK